MSWGCCSGGRRDHRGTNLGEIMTNRGLIALGLSALLFSVSGAARVPLPRMGPDELATYLPEGAQVETRLDADINGDGLIDVAAVGVADDRRVIRVMLGYTTQTDLGYRPVGEGSLDLSPLAKASLVVRKNVLIVEDLTGGTTAIQSRYRYRFDSKADRMQLIGDDVTLYSRTNQHGSVEVSTNRLTGQQLITKSSLAPKASAAALIPGKPLARTVSRKPIYMEEAPLADETIEKAD